MDLVQPGPKITKREMADWLVNLVLFMGGTTYTAYTVAGLFVKDLSVDADGHLIWKDR